MRQIPSSVINVTMPKTSSTRSRPFRGGTVPVGQLVERQFVEYSNCRPDARPPGFCSASFPLASVPSRRARTAPDRGDRREVRPGARLRHLLPRHLQTVPPSELRRNGPVSEPGDRLVATVDGWRAWVPEAPTFPYVLLLMPDDPVPDLPSLEQAGRRAMAGLLVDVLDRLDRLFEAETPYMLWIHQRPFDGRRLAGCAAARRGRHAVAGTGRGALRRRRRARLRCVLQPRGPGGGGAGAAGGGVKILEGRPWERPELTSRGRVPPSATLRRPPVSLNGRWDFVLLPHPDAAVGEWTTIEVPGLWTMQGFAPPQYTNVQMPFDEPPPRVPDENPTGVYRRRFERPPLASVVSSCTSAAARAPCSSSSTASRSASTRTPGPPPSSTSPTCSARRATSSPARVVQWSDATFVEDQDQWWHGGLPRDVFLYATPREHIADVWSRAGYADGRFVLDLVGRGRGRAPTRRGARGETGARRLRRRPPVEALRSTRRARLDRPRRRTLYTLRRHRRRATTCRCQVGFRSVEIRDRPLLVNGGPVYIRG